MRPRLPSRLLARAALLGLGSATFQTLFSREFLAAFSGNEAVLASLLGAWLALTALGAFWGRGARAQDPPSSATTALTLAAFGPAAVAALAAARAIPATFPAGAPPGAAGALAWAALLLAVPCALSGLGFSRLAREEQGGGGPVYAAESAGAALAGALLSLVLLGRLPAPLLASLVVLFAGLAAALASEGRALAAGLLASAVAAGLVAFAGPFFPHGALPGAVVEEERDGVGGRIVLARSTGQRDLLLDRRPVASDADPAAAEEAAHLTLSFHPRPESVAVLGIPPLGATALMVRHGATRIDVVIEDPALLQTLRHAFSGAWPSEVAAHAVDARQWLLRHPERYDAILLFTPEPTTAQLNRHYTQELFAAASGALREGGLLAVALPGHALWEALPRRRLHSSIRATIETVLGPPAAIPGSRTYYLARKGQPAPPGESALDQIRAALDSRGIALSALRPARLQELLAPQRVDDAARWASLPEPPNRDLSPTSYRHGLETALAGSGVSGELALIALAVVLAVLALMAFPPATRPVEMAVLTSGTAGLSAQLLLMLAYQIASGALFRETGLLLSGFMAGTAAGALLVPRWDRSQALLTRRVVAFTDAGQVLLLLVLAWAMPALVSSGAWARAVFFAATVAAGLLPGAQFASAVRARSDEGRGRAGLLYGADLVGAALAALVAYTVLVPALGVRGALLAVAALKAGSLAALAATAQRPAAAARPDRFALALPAALAGLVIASAVQTTRRGVEVWAESPLYALLAVGGLLLALALAFEPSRARAWRASLSRRLGAWRLRLRAGLERILFFVLLVPVPALPLGRCYFEVPWVFCHACPRPCIFGVLRPYLIPAALVANLHDFRFCERVCPLGTAQAGCERLRAARARRVRWLHGLRWVSLLLAVAAWAMSRFEPEVGAGGTGLAAALYRNGLLASPWVLGAGAALLLLATVVRRPFCEGLCPIGAASDLIARLERRLGPRREGAGQPEGAP